MRVTCALHRSEQINGTGTQPPLDFPTLAAVTGEAQGIPHAIRYGRRVIVAEFHCLSTDMLDPGKQVEFGLRQWLADADIKLVSSEQYIKKLTADGLI